MVREIHIENFKSIQSLKMELGRFNVLIGANGCGKSNILEGIAMGCAAAEDRLCELRVEIHYLAATMTLKGSNLNSPE